MFERDDENYLIERLCEHEVVLFVGSGFSLNAKNLLDENFPTGPVLGEKLWNFLGYNQSYGRYDGTSLADLFQAFLHKDIDVNLKQEFLENHLVSREIPEGYDAITRVLWRRIYSTNIDDIIEKIYRRNNRKVQELKYPKDKVPQGALPRDRTSVIYLHGKLPCDPNDVVFSPQQYAKAQFVHEPLYEQFVYDYAAFPTIFVGTAFGDPLFERYLVARGERYGVIEERPRSFLITPEISPVKADNLRNALNVHHVKGTTSRFLGWINTIQSHLPKPKEEKEKIPGREML